VPPAAATQGVGTEAAAAVGGAALTGTAPTPTDQPAPPPPGPATAQPQARADAGDQGRNPAGGQSAPPAPAEAAARGDITGVPAFPGVAAAAAPATGPTAAAAPAAAPPPATPMPGPPATQLAMRIAPLRLDADGVHRLTVNLHPVDLGPVQVVAEVRNGTINVQLTGSTDAGTDALRNAMDDLRRELEQSGFGNTTLDLRQGQQDQPRQQFAVPGGARGGGSGTAAGPAPEPAPAPPPIRPAEDGRLDIRA
jgi:flagellar hook-length control protein FliK